MVSNYIKLAVRNLGKRKGYSLLNILGLAIGITCCLLIFQYVSFERSYDNTPKNAKQIAGYVWILISRENFHGNPPQYILHLGLQ